jgi:hypothetical protein
LWALKRDVGMILLTVSMKKWDNREKVSLLFQAFSTFLLQNFSTIVRKDDKKKKGSLGWGWGKRIVGLFQSFGLEIGADGNSLTNKIHVKIDGNLVGMSQVSRVAATSENKVFLLVLVC